MTDKQIIIDGVDVSGCTRYCADNGKCTAFKSQYLCSERNNCYTKRILKKNKTINILKEKLLRKEQECEELKKQHQADKGLITSTGKMNYQLLQEYDKLKTVLTEIKEIAEICKCHNADGCYECKYFDDCEVEDEEIPTRDVCKLILQKISECEGNDE